MSKQIALIVGAVSAAVGISMFYKSHRAGNRAKERNNQLVSDKDTMVLESGPQIEAGFGEVDKQPPNYELVSVKCEFLRYYGDMSLMPIHDIEAVDRLFDFAVRHNVFAEHEAIDNRSLLKILLGRNSQGIRFELPKSLHQDGMLVDRWGRRLLIHQVSNSEIGVRSAGPDGMMLTSDDVFVEPISPFPIGSGHL